MVCVCVCVQAILQDLFPGVEIPEHDYGRLQSEIISVQENNKLQVVLTQVKKVIQLFETMIVRHGVMLVGPTGSGKTTVYRVSGLWVREGGRQCQSVSQAVSQSINKCRSISKYQSVSVNQSVNINQSVSISISVSQSVTINQYQYQCQSINQ